MLRWTVTGLYLKGTLYLLTTPEYDTYPAGSLRLSFYYLISLHPFIYILYDLTQTFFIFPMNSYNFCFYLIFFWYFNFLCTFLCVTLYHHVFKLSIIYILSFILFYLMSSHNNFMSFYSLCNIPLEPADRLIQLTAHWVILIKPHSLIWFWFSIQDQLSTVGHPTFKPPSSI